MTAAKPDGLVHQLVMHTQERGTRTITVKCGREMPKYRAQDRLSGASCWGSDVTCEEC